MVVSKHVLFLLLCLLLLPQSHSKCKESYSCRNFTLRFPFTDIHDPGCGLFAVGGCDSTSQEEHPWLQIGASTSAKYILNQPSNNTFTILDFLLQTLLESPRCFSYMNVSLPQSPSVSFTFSPNITFFACFNKSSNDEIQEYFESYRREECDASTLYYKIPATESHNGAIPRDCSLTQLPVKSEVNSTQLSDMLTSSFSLEWSVSEDCDRCYRRGGQCLADNQNRFYCEKTGILLCFNLRINHTRAKNNRDNRLRGLIVKICIHSRELLVFHNIILTYAISSALSIYSLSHGSHTLFAMLSFSSNVY